jgi:hypothetical protein
LYVYFLFCFFFTCGCGGESWEDRMPLFTHVHFSSLLRGPVVVMCTFLPLVVDHLLGWQL